MNGENFESAQRLGFKPGENLFYVHGVGVDLDHYSAPPTDGISVRAVLGINPGDVVVTCVAELINRKNHAFLLEAWQEFTRRCDCGPFLGVP